MAEEQAPKQEETTQPTLAVEAPKQEAPAETKETDAKDVVTKEEIKEEEKERKPARKTDLDNWVAKTALGKQVQAGEVTDLNDVLDKGEKILEVQIVDTLVPMLQSDLLMIGQAKGKFGGGKRRAFRQTQKKTKEGNKPKFTTYAVVGDKNGLVGLGYGKAKETVPAREKAFRNAKKNVFKINRGCGSWECNCQTAHTIPFRIAGKCGSVEVILFPAPKGTGLVIEQECAKILAMAGIQDVWAKTLGQAKTKINTIKACEKALKNLMTTRVSHDVKEKLTITGAVKTE